MQEEMIYWLYAHLLKRQITELPGHVCFMINAKDMADAPENLYRVTSWCNDLSAYVAKHHPSNPAGIRGLTFHISTPAPGEPDAFLPAIRKIGTISRLNLHYGDHKEVTGTGMDVVVAVGKSGREEITECIRRMARDQVPPENVDEQLLDSYLTFRYTPDQERGRLLNGFPHLAVGLFRALLLRCELEVFQVCGLPADPAGLPVPHPPFREVRENGCCGKTFVFTELQNIAL
jgi:undecaprenyl diphosphate synthase